MTFQPVKSGWVFHTQLFIFQPKFCLHECNVSCPSYSPDCVRRRVLLPSFSLLCHFLHPQLLPLFSGPVSFRSIIFLTCPQQVIVVLISIVCSYRRSRWPKLSLHLARFSRYNWHRLLSSEAWHRHKRTRTWWCRRRQQLLPTRTQQLPARGAPQQLPHQVSLCRWDW